MSDLRYVERVMEAMADAMPGEDADLLRLYTLLALTKGRATTLSDVHDAWSLWRMMTRPDHPSLVPWDELTQEVQEMDRPYMEAIHRLAAWIVGEAEQPTLRIAQEEP